ncbi:MAG: ABC-F family ATP-binding cassette domain-containing protein [Gemmatimonadetes bacterium]|nr:ABC-F family ATP-binding cassette domain-containing protein [Gemmatimonadota bacterium]
MISISNLGKFFGDQILFAGVSIQLNAGERYGLIGANGSGKTTLLNILSGEVEPSEGTVSLPKRLRLGVLKQDHFLYEDQDILGVALMGNPELWNAMVEKEALLAKAEEHFDSDRFSELEEIVQQYDGYAAESRAATILEGLGLPADVHRNLLSTLSGGFKLRVLLAQVLASTPDVLLLDEPTNHLDILSIRWLEIFLCEFPGPALVISHDHRFLDNVTTNILDVDYETVTLYRGNYADFLNAKQSERTRREKEITARERDIAHHQKFVDRFRAKASKARQAQSKARMIEKKTESLVELAPSSRRYPTFRFEQIRDSGRDVLKIEGIKKAFGDNKVLHGVDLLVSRGDRLAIMGPNGIGKSTLLKIVMGELEADEGKVEWGYETHPAYFAQDHQDQLGALGQTAEQWIWDACPEKDIGFVRGRMALMLFTGDDAKKRLSSLSGGEAARLVFSRLSIGRPNVLVLDEPTNHLDLESIEALVEALETFAGTIILVSHDRWFVSQLATRVVEILPDGIRDYHGTYEEYVHFCGDDHLDADRVVLKAKKEKKKKGDENGSGRGRSRKKPRGDEAAQRNRAERRQEELMARIDVAESRLQEIDAIFCDSAYYERTPPSEVKGLEAEMGRLKSEVNDLMAEWERSGE